MRGDGFVEVRYGYGLLVERVRQRSPLLEEVTGAKVHMRLDRRPTYEQKIRRAVLLLASDFASVTPGGTFDEGQRE